MAFVEHNPAPLDRMQHRVLLDFLLLGRVQRVLVVFFGVLDFVLDRRGTGRALRVSIVQRSGEGLAARSERDRQYSLLVSVEGAIDFELTMC
jgi:hypothetical protein